MQPLSIGSEISGVSVSEKISSLPVRYRCTVFPSHSTVFTSFLRAVRLSSMGIKSNVLEKSESLSRNADSSSYIFDLSCSTSSNSFICRSISSFSEWSLLISPLIYWSVMLLSIWDNVLRSVLIRLSLSFRLTFSNVSSD